MPASHLIQVSPDKMCDCSHWALTHANYQQGVALGQCLIRGCRCRDFAIDSRSGGWWA